MENIETSKQSETPAQLYYNFTTRQVISSEEAKRLYKRGASQRDVTAVSRTEAASLGHKAKPVSPNILAFRSRKMVHGSGNEIA